MNKKEYYKHILPHFQQLGQAYFVTWILKDAIPPHALSRYTEKLVSLKSEIDRLAVAEPGAEVSNLRKKSRIQSATPELQTLIAEYNFLRKKYIAAYDELLAVQHSGTVDLSKPEIMHLIIEALMFRDATPVTQSASKTLNKDVVLLFRN